MRFGVPGTTVRLPFSRPRIAVSATWSADRHSGVGSVEAKSCASEASLEAGRDRAGAERGDGHAGRAGLAVQRVGEAERERLARRVSGVAGQRLERCCRGGHEHRTLAAFDHLRPVPRREVDDRLRVDAHLCELALTVALAERRVHAEARVVDEDAHLEPDSFGVGGEPIAGGRVGEIARQRLGPHAVLVGQRTQRVGAPGHDAARLGAELGSAMSARTLDGALNRRAGSQGPAHLARSC